MCFVATIRLRSPRKASRKISKIPFKVLDAPELQDDFYLNLVFPLLQSCRSDIVFYTFSIRLKVDWSSQNVLSVGLGACVYLWSACTSQVLHMQQQHKKSDLV